MFVLIVLRFLGEWVLFLKIRCLSPVGDSVCVKPRQRVDFGAVRVSDFEVEVGSC